MSDPDPVHKSSPLCGNIGEPGRLLRDFDRRQALLQDKVIKFRAKGFCMYPSIRPKDLLFIEYRKCRQIQVGQVAVYRRQGNLFGHRVVEKGSSDQGDYILTRSDVSKGPGESPVFDRDIAGVVVGIQRKGRLLPCAKTPGTLWDRVFLKGLSGLFKIKSFLRKITSAAAGRKV